MSTVSPQGAQVSRAQAQAKARLRAEHGVIQERRARQFLFAQWVLLGLAAVLVVLPALSGTLSADLATKSLWFLGVVAAVTAVGSLSFRREGARPRLVLALLYLDSILGVVFYFNLGEFETPNLAVLLLPVFMAPVFADKRHAWGVAVTEIVLYLGALAGRHAGLLDYWIVGSSEQPGWSLRPELTEVFGSVDYLLASSMGFIIATLGAAFLAGQASLQILTSQKDLEDEVDRQTRRLARTNAELNDRNRALDEFNAALSHDLKSPLTTTLLAAESLMYTDPAPTDEARQTLEMICNSTERMAELVRELLKLSRMTDVLGDGERVDFKAVFDHVIEDLGGRLVEQRAELIVGGDLPEALANRSLIREAVQNLIENALKYGDPDAPRIRVEAVGAPWGRVAIAIEDNGPGIPEDDRELVFRPFLRLTRDKKRSDGVGAGLAIVQRIVSVHGGRIRIEDGEVLKGARFIIELSAFGALETLRD